MRHLMNPLDFSVEELDKLFALADDIEKDPPNTPTNATARSSPPASTSPAPAHA